MLWQLCKIYCCRHSEAGGGDGGQGGVYPAVDDDPDAWAKVKMHTYTCACACTCMQIDMEWDGLSAFTVTCHLPSLNPRSSL